MMATTATTTTSIESHRLAYWSVGDKIPFYAVKFPKNVTRKMGTEKRGTVKGNKIDAQTHEYMSNQETADESLILCGKISGIVTVWNDEIDIRKPKWDGINGRTGSRTFQCLTLIFILFLLILLSCVCFFLYCFLFSWHFVISIPTHIYHEYHHFNFEICVPQKNCEAFWIINRSEGIEWQSISPSNSISLFLYSFCPIDDSVKAKINVH